MAKKTSIIGIITCIIYFISVGLFLATQSAVFLTAWELMTVISGPVVLLVLLGFSKVLSTPDTQKKLLMVFMGCTCALTAVAHIVNISVTRRLISEGVEVPTYFQIGYWPSVEMAVDYTAWGLFTGLAFLAISIPLSSNIKELKRIKIISLVCSFLCIAGFCGALFINENIWYLAPLGYGIGLIILCVQVLLYKESSAES